MVKSPLINVLPVVDDMTLSYAETVYESGNLPAAMEQLTNFLKSEFAKNK